MMNRKVIEYKTLSDSTWMGLDAVVNKYIKHGWNLHGEQYTDPSQHNRVQVMVKYEEQIATYRAPEDGTYRGG